ncbi:MAG: hypothetical protein PVG39_16380 [Desulfobacteraceae bacterium]|jgi:hypothetical protein
MVKQQEDNNTEKVAGKASGAEDRRARKINASTVYETCTEQLSPFGRLLGLIEFEEVSKNEYIEPNRKTKLGNYHMVVGMLMLLFIGFNRLWHFTWKRRLQNRFLRSKPSFLRPGPVR